MSTDVGDSRILAEVRRLAELAQLPSDEPKIMNAAAENLDVNIERVERVVQQAQDSEAGIKPPEPLFRWQDHTVRSLLDTEPPERRMLIRGFLPRDIIGALGGVGGIGKSYLVLQLAVSIATGVKFLGMPIDAVGSVVIVSAEDDLDEIHRRLHVVVRHIERQEGVIFDRDALAERLIVVPRVGEENLLTMLSPTGEIMRTPLLRQLVAALRQTPDLKLTIVDPLSRFRGGNENSNEHVQRFCEALEHLRLETGCCVIVPAHVSKSSTKNTDSGQDMLRGASALTDSVRWVLTMRRMSRDEAPTFDVPEEDVDRYVRIELPKPSYTAPWAPIWVRRELGVLKPIVLSYNPDGARRAIGDERYGDLRQRLTEVFRKSGPQTANALETRWSGRDGSLGAGRGAVMSAVNRGIIDGYFARFMGKVTRTNGKPYKAIVFGLPEQAASNDQQTT